MNARAWIATALSALATLGVAGCSSGESSHAPQSDQQTGTITAQLTAVGPDGATYSLDQVQMNIAPQGGGAPGYLQFNSNAGTQSFSIAAGSYSGNLISFVGSPDGSFGWTLIRQGDGGSTTVSAVLLDTQPYQFMISAGATTNLALHFEIASVGTITFSAGTLTTSLGVEAGTLPPGHATAAGSVAFTQASQPSGNAPLDKLIALPPSGSGNVPYTVSITLTSPFVMGTDQACANATATVTATAAPDAGTQDAYAAWVQEVNGGTGYMCFYDAVSSFGSNVGILITRTGAANTPLFQGVYGSATNALFQISMTQLTVPPFLNNGVLSLGTLNQPVTLPINYFTLSTTGTNTFAQVTTGGQPSTLQLSP
jgi:hypothetical protein